MTIIKFILNILPGVFIVAIIFCFVFSLYLLINIKEFLIVYGKKRTIMMLIIFLVGLIGSIYIILYFS